MTEQERVDTCCKDIRRVEQKIDALDRLVTAQFKARDVSVQDLAKVMEKRLDGMNEFRGALSEQAAEFLTKTSYELANSGLVRDVAQIRDTMATKPEMASVIARVRARPTRPCCMVSPRSDGRCDLHGSDWPRNFLHISHVRPLNERPGALPGVEYMP